MKNTIKVVSFLFLYYALLSLGSCSLGKQDNQDNTSFFESFPVRSQIDFENLIKFDKQEARKIILRDSSLLVWNIDGATDYFFYEYSLTSRKLIRKFIKGGRGYGEALGAFSGGLYSSNMIWFHDITLNKLLIYNLNKDPVGKDSTGIREYPIHRLYYSTQLMNDTTKLLSTGEIEPNNEKSNFKIQEVNISTGKRLNEYGTFANIPQGIQLGLWKMANQSFLFLKPDNNKSVLASRYMDQVEIFDMKTKSSKIVKGPENYQVEYTPFKIGDKVVMNRNKRTRFAFIGGMVTDQYIYLLYSGDHEAGNHVNTGEYIYVYNWNGVPVKEFKMNKFVSCFAVSEKDNLIYAFDPKTGYLLKAKI